MTQSLLRGTFGVLVLLAPGLALAHTSGDGAGHGFAEGVSHPFTGLDHLMAMVGIGIWSAMTARRWWLAPGAFALMVLAGALAWPTGLALSAVEGLVALSLVVVGALMASRARWPAAAMSALAGGFAVFHGAAHGAELAGASAMAGMVIGTAILHCIGLAAGFAIRPLHPAWHRLTGAAVSLFGIATLLGWA